MLLISISPTKVLSFMVEKELIIGIMLWEKAACSSLEIPSESFALRVYGKSYPIFETSYLLMISSL